MFCLSLWVPGDVLASRSAMRTRSSLLCRLDRLGRLFGSCKLGGLRQRIVNLAHEADAVRESDQTEIGGTWTHLDLRSVFETGDLDGCPLKPAPGD